MAFVPASAEDGIQARALVDRLLGILKRPASGEAIELDLPDVHGIEKFAQEILGRHEAGNNSRWGPNVASMNSLCKVLFTDEQYTNKGLRRAEVAQALLDAMPSEETVSPPGKRVRIEADELASVQAHLNAIRARKKEKENSQAPAVHPGPVTSPWARFTELPTSDPPTISAGLSWPCPLLAARRGQFLAGNQALLQELRAQALAVKDWRTTKVGNVSMLQARTSELPPILGELAGISAPFPKSLGPARIAAAYKMAIDDYANALEKRMRNNNEMVVGSLWCVPPPASAAPQRIVAFAPSRRSSVVIPSCLSGPGAQVFSTVTARTVTPTNLPQHIEDCCHLVAAHQAHKTDALGNFGIKIKRKVPATAIAIIARRMAPPASRLVVADTFFPGTSAEAIKQRAAVDEALDDVFEQSVVVASERIKRGTATQRRDRERLGAALSQRERDESMQRESTALARIVVISRLLDRGSAALGKLSIGVQIPSLAEDIAAMTGMDITAAAACAKSALVAGISQSAFQEQEASRKRKTTAAIAASRSQREQGQGRGGRGRGRGRGGRGRGRGRKRRRGRRGRGNRTCHRCGSRDHQVANCPQPAPAREE